MDLAIRVPEMAIDLFRLRKSVRRDFQSLPTGTMGCPLARMHRAKKITFVKLESAIVWNVDLHELHSQRLAVPGKFCLASGLQDQGEQSSNSTASRTETVKKLIAV